jgi:ABC-2 type transport system ATP-binding protein
VLKKHLTTFRFSKTKEKSLFLGPNGAGKSTLMKILTYIHPDEGSAMVNGHDITKQQKRCSFLLVITRTQSFIPGLA